MLTPSAFQGVLGVVVLHAPPPLHCMAEPCSGSTLVLYGVGEQRAALWAAERLCPALGWLGFTGSSSSPTNPPKAGALERMLPGAGLAPAAQHHPRGRGAEGLFPIALRCLAWHSCFPALMAPHCPCSPQGPQVLGKSHPSPKRWLPAALLGSAGRLRVRCSLGYWFIELLQGTAWIWWDMVTGTFSYCGGGWQEGTGRDEGSLCLLCPLQATMETLRSFR